MQKCRGRHLVNRGSGRGKDLWRRGLWIGGRVRGWGGIWAVKVQGAPPCCFQPTLGKSPYFPETLNWHHQVRAETGGHLPLKRVRAGKEIFSSNSLVLQ